MHLQHASAEVVVVESASFGCARRSKIPLDPHPVRKWKWAGSPATAVINGKRRRCKAWIDCGEGKVKSNHLYSTLMGLTKYTENNCSRTETLQRETARINSKPNLRAKANQVTWTPCMCSLQTLNKDSGDQLYRYYRYGGFASFTPLAYVALLGRNPFLRCACCFTGPLTISLFLGYVFFLFNYSNFSMLCIISNSDSFLSFEQIKFWIIFKFEQVQIWTFF
jgi:hypothetical protein